MMKLKIELLKVFLLEFEWCRNKKEKQDEDNVDSIEHNPADADK